MAKKRGKISDRQPTHLKRKKKLRWGRLVSQLREVERLTDKLYDIAANEFAQRVIELEAALDFYAWGTNPKGELEPMQGEEYVKAIAKDGGAIARAYLKDRYDGAYYGAPNKNAPGGWGVWPVEETTKA